jgi:hypothetical protein
MATIDELQNNIYKLEQDLSNVNFRINETQAELRNFEVEIQRSIARGDNDLAQSQTTTYNRLTQEQTNRIAYRDRVQADLTAAKDNLAKEQQTQSQQNTAQSAGQEVKQSGDAGVTNPAQPTQTFNAPDAATTATTQPDPVIAVSNSDTPAVGVTASPSPDATASVVQTNAEEAVPQASSTPGANLGATRERSRTQSYVFYATTVTSEFRQGRFEQTLEGSLYIFPRPKTSQVVDPPVKAADLGSQSFGLTDNTRVNPGKQKVASAQDARKATIVTSSQLGSQNFGAAGNPAPTNVQFTGQGSNLSNPGGMDFSPISGFGA